MNIVDDFIKAATRDLTTRDKVVISSFFLVLALVIEELVVKSAVQWGIIYSNEFATLTTLVILYALSRSRAFGKVIPAALPHVGSLHKKTRGVETWFISVAILLIVTFMWMTAGTNAIIPLIPAPQAISPIATSATSGFLLLSGGTGLLEELTHVALFFAVMNAFLDSSFVFLGLSSGVLWFAYPQLGIVWLGLTGLSAALTKIKLKGHLRRLFALGMAMVYSTLFFAALHPSEAGGVFVNHVIFRGIMNVVAMQFGVLTAVGIHAANNGIQLAPVLGLPKEFVLLPVGLVIFFIWLSEKHVGKVKGR